MSYRIWLGIAKRKELNEYLATTMDDYFEFGYKHQDIELHDELDIERFSPITKFKDIEYNPYILIKEDLQYIIDYYKELNLKNYEEKMKITDKDFNADKRKQLGMHLMYYHIVGYFKGLIKHKKNISDAGFFLLDYFYLVRIYDTIKEDECIIITHG